MAAERKLKLVPNHEQELAGDLVSLDPRIFRKDGNVALAITNLSAALDGEFNLRRYNRSPAEIVKVQDPLTREIEYRIRNGHHRTIGAILAVEAGKIPGDRIDFLDVTEDTKKEKFPGHNERDYLTDGEYYQLLGEETKYKGEISFRRMAAHIFTDWKRWVGVEIAQEFPALAALHTLGREAYTIRFSNEGMTHRAIDNSEMTIMGGENPEQRAALKAGLKTMASRIIGSGLGYDEIAFAGFQMVTDAYEDIGVDVKAREINGLLALRDVDRRFVPASQDPELRRQQRDEFGSRLTTSFQQITESDPASDLKLREIINMLSAPVKPGKPSGNNRPRGEGPRGQVTGASGSTTETSRGVFAEALLLYDMLRSTPQGGLSPSERGQLEQVAAQLRRLGIIKEETAPSQRLRPVDRGPKPATNDLYSNLWC